MADFNIQVGPNPFVERLAVSYELDNASKVSINLFDAAGRFVTNVVNENQQSGEFNYEKNLQGLVNGTYFLVVRVNNRVAALPVIKQ